MGIEGKKNILGSREYLVNPTIEGQVLPGTGLTMPAFSGVMAGALGATCYVVANNAKAEVKAHAQSLHDAGYPVWVCDGIDDQVEIQAAIDALPAGGGKVLLMEGIYNISVPPDAPVNTWAIGIIRRPNITIAGQGAGTVLRFVSSANWGMMFRVDAAHNTRFEHLTIDMATVAVGLTIVRGIFIINSIGCVIHNSVIRSQSYTEGLMFVGVNSRNNIISNNVITGGADGISLGTHASHNIIQGNVIRDASTEGIDLERGNSFNIITDNIIKNCAGGIRFNSLGTGADVATSNIVANNIIRGFTSFGIRIGGNESIVEGNLIEVPDNRIGIAIRLQPGASAETPIPQDNLVQGNYILVGAGATAIDDAGINTWIYEQHPDLFMDVLAASATHIHPTITPDGLAHTNVTSPDVPRNTMIRITNTDAINAQIPGGGNIVIEGVDVRGRTTLETLVVPATSIPAGGTSDVFGSKAFATVTKVTYYTETNTAITVSVGISDRLGLSNVIYAAGDVYKVKKGNADVTVGTVDTANGTVDCATIVNGDDFTIYYRSNLNILT